MFLGMRDVLAHRTIGDDYSVFKTLGITAMEVRIERDLTLQFLGEQHFSIADAESRERLLAHVTWRGVAIKGLLLCTKFDGSEDETRWVRESARFAHELGLESIRVDCGRPDPGDAAGRDRLRAELTPVFETLLDAAGEFGVKLALENHGQWTNQPEVMCALLDQFAARGLRLCLDTGNFYCTGQRPLREVYAAMARFGESVTTTHVKNASYPAEVRETKRDSEQFPYKNHSILIEQGDIDHAKVFRILKDAGYDGGWFYEDEALYRVPEGTDKAAAMRTTLAALKQDLASVEPAGVAVGA
ncbi:MAG: sugar phosphate isomerase/epimerase [Kiritimatiellae bacterium]|nr:sugar phosphate isomerase/epimerase [Kiritimatiellia bacterium]